MNQIGTLPQWALAAACAAPLLIASVRDLAVRLIPDWVPLLLAGAGVARQAASGTLGAALLVAGTVFLLTALCWRRGWMGGGDVKLLAGCALLVPPDAVPELVLTTALCGGVLAGIYLGLGRIAPPAGGRRTRLLAARLWRTEVMRARRRGPLPYGCAIAASALIVLLGR